MNTPLTFVTQLPRDDGCGVVVLQMLSGRTYDEIAAIIDWPIPGVHYSTWTEIMAGLDALGIAHGEVMPAETWDEVTGLAVVHVQPDHFILVDLDRGLFYDPGQEAGPQTSSEAVPRSWLPVRR
ncbi:hypothetical protein [Aestuariimicrobium ganziense]|uniref:hypothetical protein n=1 Tax=Aestuariimicrobium ganziense TaxID=2773677 RepID=UPI001941BB19|nr:hypothetical protein [Aestuariimicrobium ganziense]